MKPWFWIYAGMVILLTTVVNVGSSGTASGSSSGRWGSSSSGSGWSHK